MDSVTRGKASVKKYTKRNKKRSQDDCCNNMSENNTTAGQAAGTSKYKKHHGEQVLGKIEEMLGKHVYKFNTKDQADVYILTTEALIDYVGREYGKDMRILVKYNTERTFTEPTPPRTSDSTPGLLE